MLKNYLKVAVRNLIRHKGYSAINITGLAVGMACTVLILLWVQDELNYDRFHEKADVLYRVEENQHYSAGAYHVNVTPFPAGPAFEEGIPEIVAACRYTWAGGLLFRYGEKAFFENDIRAVDPAFLRIFTFPLVQGDRETALDDPHSLILTREMVEKYFGDEEPIGKVISVDNQYEFTVTGIVEKLPENSSLRFSVLLPFIFQKERGWWHDHWGTNSIGTYVQLQPGTSIRAVEEKMTAIQKSHLEESTTDFVLAPLTDMHLRSYFGYGRPMGDIQYVYIFTALALFVLLIACINFMNLSTARSAKRAREIGLRKVVGALRGNMIRQFLGESILIACIALFFAVPLVEFLLPFFNELSGKDLALDLMGNRVLLLLIGVALATGLVAGSYPALFLSSFRPAVVLKGNLRSGASSSLFRKALVVLQFTLSIGLIIGTGVVYDQVTFMRGKQVGYDKEQLLNIRMRGDISGAYDELKAELIAHPAVLGVSATRQRLPHIGSNSSGGEWDGKDPELDVVIGNTQVDYDFVETMGIELVEGRSFSRAFSTDAEEAYLVNEKLVELMGVESAVGERFSLWREGRIIGVMRDFHFKSVRDEIEPLVLGLNDPEDLTWMIVKFHSESAVTGVEFLKETWERVVPNYPLEYEFLDREFDHMYRTEERMGGILKYFSIVAVLIGCLGLFGLASFMAEQRTKEIGVRKVLGASVAGIVLLLTREFTKWVLLANLIAWPIAWYAMSRWLEGFAFRVELGWEIFALAGAGALGIAWLTVSWQAVRAALSNPIEALRYE
jgi:putative ABC transport system permease protein